MTMTAIGLIGRALVPLGVLTLAACQAGGEPVQPLPAEPVAATPGRYDAVPAFAEAVCGDCHALVPHDLSPNVEAPPFAEIANRPGLTEQTLRAFLSDAHNYPEAMDFDLEGNHVDEMTAYFLSLRDEDYELPGS